MTHDTLGDLGMQSVSPRFGAHLTIDLGAIRRNYRRLRDLASPAETAAVIKADAYGCGIENVAPALADEGCRTFFCALISEGIAARLSLQDCPDAAVYILNGFSPASVRLLQTHRLWPVLGSVGEIRSWLTAGSELTAALHFDTGMARLGLEECDVGNPVIEQTISTGKIALLMTHLACADEPSHSLNRRQIERFQGLGRKWPALPTSLANSAATISGWAHETSLARPGIALYGGRAVTGIHNPMEPVVRLDARIVQTRTVRSGETVGYGATWTAGRDSRVAVVAAGYADGYPRSASRGDERPVGFAAVGGHRVPIVGRVSMDLIAIDVTDADPALAEPGKTIELLGPTVTVDQVADSAGTIAYEVLTGLGPRFGHSLYDSEAANPAGNA